MSSYKGIIPAAGKASRIGGLDKFLLPTGDANLMHRLIALMALPTGAITIMFRYPYQCEMARNHWGYAMDINCVADPCDTMSETVLEAHYSTDEFPVLFGMPDTYFEDAQAFTKLRAAIDDGADLAVGHFETRPEQRASLGICAMKDNGELYKVVDKLPSNVHTRAWGVLAWRPSFWEHIDAATPHIGYAINPAIEAGLRVVPVAMDGRYWDCGTIDEYAHMLRATVLEKEYA